MREVNVVLQVAALVAWTSAAGAQTSRPRAMELGVSALIGGRATGIFEGPIGITNSVGVARDAILELRASWARVERLPHDRLLAALRKHGRLG